MIQQDQGYFKIFLKQYQLSSSFFFITSFLKFYIFNQISINNKSFIQKSSKHTMNRQAMLRTSLSSKSFKKGQFRQKNNSQSNQLNKQNQNGNGTKIKENLNFSSQLLSNSNVLTNPIQGLSHKPLYNRLKKSTYINAGLKKKLEEAKISKISVLTQKKAYLSPVKQNNDGGQLTPKTYQFFIQERAKKFIKNNPLISQSDIKTCNYVSNSQVKAFDNYQQLEKTQNSLQKLLKQKRKQLQSFRKNRLLKKDQISKNQLLIQIQDKKLKKQNQVLKLRGSEQVKEVRRKVHYDLSEEQNFDQPNQNKELDNLKKQNLELKKQNKQLQTKISQRNILKLKLRQRNLKISQLELKIQKIQFQIKKSPSQYQQLQDQYLNIQKQNKILNQKINSSSLQFNACESQTVNKVITHKDTIIIMYKDQIYRMLGQNQKLLGPKIYKKWIDSIQGLNAYIEEEQKQFRINFGRYKKESKTSSQVCNSTPIGPVFSNHEPDTTHI